MNVVIVVLVVGALAVLIFKKFSNIVYYIGIVDIFLRVLSFIAANIPIKEISNFIYTYFPSSVPSIINMYSIYIIRCLFNKNILEKEITSVIFYCVKNKCLI